MKEFGGYFELEPFSGKEYHSSGILRFNYGRTALQFLLREKGIRRIYLPYYICDSVIDAVKALDIDIFYYHVDRNFMPLLDEQPAEKELVLIVNYYALLSDAQVDDLIAKYGRVVVDNTHAFFRRPPVNADATYSCRKFFGVPDGGYLASDLDCCTIPGDRSEDRLEFLVGRLESSASECYDSYRKAEEAAEHEPVKAMSRFTQRILCGVDYEYVKNRRTENYAKLHDLLSAYNMLTDLSVPEGAFMYPLMVRSNPDKLRKYLHRNKVYVPTLWGNVLDMVPQDSVEAAFVTHILPLPVDQRYTTEDMTEIANIVKRGIEEC